MKHFRRQPFEKAVGRSRVCTHPSPGFRRATIESASQAVCQAANAGTARVRDVRANHRRRERRCGSASAMSLRVTRETHNARRSTTQLWPPANPAVNPPPTGVFARWGAPGDCDPGRVPSLWHPSRGRHRPACPAWSGGRLAGVARRLGICFSMALGVYLGCSVLIGALPCRLS